MPSREFRDGKTGATKTTYLELLEVDGAVAVLVLERKLLRDEVPVVAVVFHDAQVHEQRGKLLLEFGDVRGRRELSAIRACGDRDGGLRARSRASVGALLSAEVHLADIWGHIPERDSALHTHLVEESAPVIVVFLELCVEPHFPALRLVYHGLEVHGGRRGGSRRACARKLSDDDDCTAVARRAACARTCAEDKMCD